MQKAPKDYVGETVYYVRDSMSTEVINHKKVKLSAKRRRSTKNNKEQNEKHEKKEESSKQHTKAPTSSSQQAALSYPLMLPPTPTKSPTSNTSPFAITTTGTNEE